MAALLLQGATQDEEVAVEGAADDRLSARRPMRHINVAAAGRDALLLRRRRCVILCSMSKSSWQQAGAGRSKAERKVSIVEQIQSLSSKRFHNHSKEISDDQEKS
ncbi:MAG: hypothetical protein OXG84_04340 [Chloroflexi bacterium]|nr:hypothetical protein [Chloroflexota bacterium]